MNSGNPFPRRVRSREFAAIAAAALSLLVPGLPGTAGAQNTPNPSAVSPPPSGSPGLAAGIPQAPVGHRQPRPSDLPPDVNREENANAPPRDAPSRSAIDSLPTICVRC
jgi:hypothetical protein